MHDIKRSFATLQTFSGFLLLGTLLALFWANSSLEHYEKFINGALLPDSNFLAHALTHGKTAFSLHFLVNDLFMVLFFGIAMKEVTESFLPGGALSSVRKAAMPALATLGGVLGPIATFFALRAALAPDPDIANAWAVPTATDIAYCWLFARIIFGNVHPAVTFLLVLAVLDDLIGMMIIAVFYTNPADMHLKWLGLVALAAILCEGMRRGGVKSFWPYLLIGAPLSWYGLHNAGVHAALALVPVVPFMPHAERDAGLFASPADHDEHGHDGHGDHGHGHHSDTLNQFEHFFKPIVDVGLFGFGLANAGVILSMESLGGKPTWIILGALIIGKTVGIFLFSLVGTALGLSLPKPMKMKQVLVLGCVAGIGFTVALFVTSVALKQAPPALLESFAKSGTEGMLKLGALMSFSAGALAFVLSKLVGIKRLNTPEELAAAIAQAEAAEGVKPAAPDASDASPAPSKPEAAASSAHDEDEDQDEDPAPAKPSTPKPSNPKPSNPKPAGAKKAKKGKK